jgi:hypothetical protein
MRARAESGRHVMTQFFGTSETDDEAREVADGSWTMMKQRSSPCSRTDAGDLRQQDIMYSLSLA